MKKFKAMFAATAAVMALSAVSVPMSAFAIDDLQRYNLTDGTWDPANVQGQVTGDTPQAQINVDFSIEPTYTVTIPADVRINASERRGSNAVSVEDVFLNKGKAVEVSVASQNAYEMKLNLEGGALDSANKIPYSLRSEFAVGRGFTEMGDIANKTGQGTLTIVDRNLPESATAADVFKPIITVPTGSKDLPGTGGTYLTYSISQEQDIPVAGTYSDRLTFKIAVVDAPANNSNPGNVDPQQP